MLASISTSLWITEFPILSIVWKWKKVWPQLYVSFASQTTSPGEKWLHGPHSSTGGQGIVIHWLDFRGFWGQIIGFLNIKHEYQGSGDIRVNSNWRLAGPELLQLVILLTLTGLWPLAFSCHLQSDKTAIRWSLFGISLRLNVVCN